MRRALALLETDSDANNTNISSRGGVNSIINDRTRGDANITNGRTRGDVMEYGVIRQVGAGTRRLYIHSLLYVWPDLTVSL